MKNINSINKFQIGDIVKVIPGAEGLGDYFSGNAIYQGLSETVSKCIALERADGDSGSAQNGWWNFQEKDIKYLQLVKSIKRIKIPASANNLKGALIILKPKNEKNKRILGKIQK